jgi:hypothetical protein
MNFCPSKFANGFFLVTAVKERCGKYHPFTKIIILPSSFITSTVSTFKRNKIPYNSGCKTEGTLS